MGFLFILFTAQADDEAAQCRLNLHINSLEILKGLKRGTFLSVEAIGDAMSGEVYLLAGQFARIRDDKVVLYTLQGQEEKIRFAKILEITEFPTLKDLLSHFFSSFFIKKKALMIYWGNRWVAGYFRSFDKQTGVIKIRSVLLDDATRTVDLNEISQNKTPRVYLWHIEKSPSGLASFFKQVAHALKN